jgi:hypothetical protein
MEVVDDVHECFAPLAALFSYIVSTKEVVSWRIILQGKRENTPSTTMSWSFTTAIPKLPLVRETRRLIFAEASNSAFLRDENALARCFTICVCGAGSTFFQHTNGPKRLLTICADFRASAWAFAVFPAVLWLLVAYMLEPAATFFVPVVHRFRRFRPVLLPCADSVEVPVNLIISWIFFKSCHLSESREAAAVVL